jgi:spermidine synthase
VKGANERSMRRRFSGCQRTVGIAPFILPGNTLFLPYALTLSPARVALMKRYEELARTTTRDGVRLTLLQHSEDYYIEIDGATLMSTRAPGSERALAELAVSGLVDIKKPRVLIGGLGLGFTLGAALDGLPRGATVVVAEIFTPVVEWNRKFMFESSKDRLADPRVVLELRDVVDVLREASLTSFDAILLDVDNGPSSFCLESNHRLYNSAGLARIKRALRPGGILAIWSAEPSPPFARKLGKAGFLTETATARARGRKGARHTIFLGRMTRTRG